MNYDGASPYNGETIIAMLMIRNDSYLDGLFSFINSLAFLLIKIVFHQLVAMQIDLSQNVSSIQAKTCHLYLVLIFV